MRCGRLCTCPAKAVARPARAASVLRELARRRGAPEALRRLESDLTPAQHSLYRDTAKLIASHAGRRGGKTHALVARYVRACMLYPGATIPIIQKTLGCASARAFWKTLKILDSKYNLQFSFNDALKIATAPNQAQVWMVSADKEDQVEKLRGDKYPEAWVDEAGTIRPLLLERLIEEALEPALVDLNGVLGLCGTPQPACQGPFAQACLESDSGYSVHHWTMLDNPHVGEGATAADRAVAIQQWLADRRQLRGWTEDHPTYRQEYLGEWVRSEDRLIYRVPEYAIVWSPFDAAAADWVYGLGVDVGFRDPTAFTIVAWRQFDPRLYVVRSCKRVGLIPSAIAAQIEALHTEYKFRYIVADASSPGIIEECRQRFRVPIQSSQRIDKLSFTELLNGELASGQVQLHGNQNRELLDEMNSLPRNEKGGEDKRYDNHLCDSLLYAWRHARHVHSARVLAPPAPGSAEYRLAEMEKMEKVAEEQQAIRLGDPAALWTVRDISLEDWGTW